MENNQFPQNQNPMIAPPPTPQPTPQGAAYPPPPAAAPPVPQGAAYAAPVMDEATLLKEKLERKIRNGRSSLMLIFVLSLGNFFLMLADASISFAFSLTFPYFLVGFGDGLREMTGSESALIVTHIISLVLIGFFGLLWLFSKKHLWPVVVAVVLFALDCLLLIWFVFMDVGSIANFTIDLMFHAWAMGSLIILWKSKVNLSKALKVNAPVFPVPMNR